MLNVTDRLVFESVWCKIATANSEYYAARIYHPSHPVYDSFDLLEYMSDTCDQVLGDGPNVKIMHNFQLNIKEFTSGERILIMFFVPTDYSFGNQRLLGARSRMN